MSQFRASGQGISRDFTYTGRYEDEPHFGDVDYEAALSLVRALPSFTAEAFDAGLCPPAIVLDDGAGSNLIVSSSPGKPGMYDAYMGGARGDGTVVTGVSFEKVAEIIGRFFSGAPIGVEVETLEKVAKRISGEKRTLAYASCKAQATDIDSWEKVDASVTLEELSDGRRVLSIWVSGHAPAEIPADNVIEIELSRGGFLRSTKIKVTYLDMKGKKRKASLELKDWYRKDNTKFQQLVAEFSAALPGRIKVK